MPIPGMSTSLNYVGAVRVGISSPNGAKWMIKNFKLSGDEQIKRRELMSKTLDALEGEDCLLKLQVLSVLTGVLMQHLLKDHLDDPKEAEHLQPQLLRAVLGDLRIGMGMAKTWDTHSREPKGAETPATFLGIPSKPLVH